MKREEIRAGIERRDPDQVIAAELGRHRCTINAEVRRNGGRSRYRAVDAQCRAESALSRPKVPKLVADRALAGHVARRLKAKDSPMTISLELARGVHGRVAKISHECIYQAVYSTGRGLSAGLHVGLHLKRRRRKQRGRSPVVATHSLGTFNLIGLRPEIATQRVEVGHLEGDLIVGAYTVCDRHDVRPDVARRVAHETATRQERRRSPRSTRQDVAADPAASAFDVDVGPRFRDGPAPRTRGTLRHRYLLRGAQSTLAATNQRERQCHRSPLRRQRHRPVHLHRPRTTSRRGIASTPSRDDPSTGPPPTTSTLPLSR